MQEHIHVDALRAAIEEELGSFRHFADLPVTEIEAMAARILRVVVQAGRGLEAPESRAA